jgi:large conductance mechanosensitive channel
MVNHCLILAFDFRHVRLKDRSAYSDRGCQGAIYCGGLKPMWNEFKNFAFKGNAFDLAIGVIMGGAFGKIVASMVDDLIMPIVGLATGGIDFSNKFIQLAGAPGATDLEAAKKAGATFAYGNFITIVIGFLILAFILMQLVKISNRLKKAEPPAPPAPPSSSEVLLAEIRDALRKR